MEIVKHIIIRIGITGLLVYLFYIGTEYFAPETTGSYPSMGFMLAVFGVGIVVILLILGAFIADTVYLHAKKKFILRNINFGIIGLFLIFLLTIHDKFGL